MSLLAWFRSLYFRLLKCDSTVLVFCIDFSVLSSHSYYLLFILLYHYCIILIVLICYLFSVDFLLIK